MNERLTRFSYGSGHGEYQAGERIDSIRASNEKDRVPTSFRRLIQKVFPNYDENMEVLEEIYNENLEDIVDWMEAHGVPPDEIKSIDFSNVHFDPNLPNEGNWDGLSEEINIAEPVFSIGSPGKRNKMKRILMHEMLHMISRNAMYYDDGDGNGNVSRTIHTSSQKSGVETTNTRMRFDPESQSVEFGRNKFFGAFNEGLTEWLTVAVTGEEKPLCYGHEVALIDRIISGLGVHLDTQQDVKAQVKDGTYQATQMLLKTYTSHWNPELKLALRNVYGNEALKILAALGVDDLNDTDLRNDIFTYFSIRPSENKVELEKRLISTLRKRAK